MLTTNAGVEPAPKAKVQHATAGRHWHASNAESRTTVRQIHAAVGKRLHRCSHTSQHSDRRLDRADRARRLCRDHHERAEQALQRCGHRHLHNAARAGGAGGGSDESFSNTVSPLTSPDALRVVPSTSADPPNQSA